MHVARAPRVKDWYYNHENAVKGINQRGLIFNYSYKNREVRDLAWACFSPPLLLSEELSEPGQALANCGLSFTPQRQAWLRQVDSKPYALHDHLNKLHNSRLGLYFETLWHFFLGQDRQVDLIAHNLPIRDQGRPRGHTVGEFDCLYFCRERNRHFHLELAVKYFLSHRQSTTNQPRSHWHEWLGPGNRDHLDRKIKHLTQHQILLGDHPAARQQLDELGIDSLIKEVEIKGYLFQSLADPLPAPRGFNPKHRLALWLTINTLGDFVNQQQDSRYCVLAKSHWLSLASASAQAKPLLPGRALIENLAEHFNRDSRPRLVAAFNAAGDEEQRFFVTGQSWPTTSA